MGNRNPVPDMGRYRAIMTETDREYISHREEVDENKRHQSISRVRTRIKEELPKDIELLEQHHPGLLEELREVVCDA
jgi:ppGpp synthetase/RelA/SpoT-type nucleotidyltranferase